MTRSRAYQIVVPTRDSARWIALFHERYSSLGVSPLYICDARSRDGTIDVVTSLGARHIVLTPDENRVEAMLPVTRSLVEGGWVVRFDDDEMPSAALVDWLDRDLASQEATTVALSRRDVAWTPNGLRYARMEDFYFHPSEPAFLNPQWRAFKPHEVEFAPSIHTPGFSVAGSAKAPAEAFFVHFDWLLRTFAQRCGKIREYDRQSPGLGWGLAQYYLPELYDDASARWTSMDEPEFDRLAAGVLALRRD